MELSVFIQAGSFDCWKPTILCVCKCPSRVKHLAIIVMYNLPS